MGKRAFIDLESPGETAFGTTSSDAESAAKRARGDVGYLGQDRGQQSHRKRSNSNSSNDSEAENASASPALSSSSRSHSISTINSLSDEILLHILNFLPTHYLISCEQLSHRFRALSSDTEIWKHKYYSRWVLPRLRRSHRMSCPSPSCLTSRIPRRSMHYTPRPARWPHHERFAEDLRPQGTDWKSQYRLRLNWLRGACQKRQVTLPEILNKRTLVQACFGIIFTADRGYGVGAWSTKEDKHNLARYTLDEEDEEPSALSVVPHDLSGKGFDVIIGFDNGRIAIHTLTVNDSEGFRKLSTFWASPGGKICAIASSSSYIASYSADGTCTLWHRADNEGENETRMPRLITSLRSSNDTSAVTLSIRPNAAETVVSIAYVFPRIDCGWSVGIQELLLSSPPLEKVVRSRLTTTVDRQIHSSPIAKSFTTHQSPLSSLLTYTQPPTSISYSHPYLLLSHADNTLSVYLVKSTADKFSICSGRRLWGHTSSVSGVQVSERGKAVSVTSRGDDIRIWDVEGLLGLSMRGKARLDQLEGVQAIPHNDTIASDDRVKSIQGQVTFDDEQVVVLLERGLGRLLLDCYDFN